ncbi:4Fe-4S binding protein [bacterium]|nr:4Fe-4S binding protein [bacterium]
MLLLQYVRRSAAHCAGPCAAPSRWTAVPFVLGMATGVNFCPPFAAAIATAINAGTVLRGMSYFAAFFVGTTIYLIPVPFVGLLSRWRPVAALGRLAGALIGIAYLFHAFSGFVHVADQARERATREQDGAALPAGAQRITDALFFVARTGGQPRYVVDSRHLGMRITGYGGETPLALWLETNLVVDRIEILAHHETPGFVEYVTNTAWWSSWAGAPLGDLITGAQKPDAVAGATATAGSMRRTLLAAAGEAGRVFHRALPGPEHGTGALASASAGMPSARAAVKRDLVTPFVKAVPVALLLACATLVAVIPRLSVAWVRWVIWGFSIVLLGVYRADYFTVSMIAASARGAWPGPERIVWYMVFFYALVSPLFIGRTYCRYVCPFGVLTEALGRIVPVNLALPGPVARHGRVVKYALLCTAAVLMVLAPWIPAGRFEPFHALSPGGQPRAYMAFVAAVVLASCFLKRFWCSLFCVDGALFEFIHSVRPVRGEGKEEAS